ncbi:PadR family transcriptional regulator [Actinomyces dentalis]|uniref:PadR family transcriptional regulator n=1 Tax=Actinomyces dentalis TaxID=272548 RepID=UPI000419CBE6|nr:helix-turn-helix transcriptional regulator [Actinomyces dentalis]
MSRASGYATGDLPDPAVQVLAALGRPRHGYAVMALLDERGGPDLAMGPATLYTTLRKLLAVGLIEEVDDAGPRRPYRRTEAGTASLRRNIERRRRLIALSEEILEES